MTDARLTQVAVEALADEGSDDLYAQLTQVAVEVLIPTTPPTVDVQLETEAAALPFSSGPHIPVS